ncbi:MAG: FeoB-associated Cys-rich membrane protein [Clostridia bacterium]|nr:FeoB-associated Cys-rich membrane protein [Clostridia bacterium]MDE7265037.1 FeoB-associated Cys-rich membrane protein [Clostridia bacterium]
MNGWDIAILIVVCLAVAAVVGWLIYRKVKHKGGGCDCGCGGCTACDKCKPNSDSTDTDKH